MLAAWRRTSPKLSVPDRMGKMMSDAAVSITISTLTNIVSFTLGMTVPLRSAIIFSQYSALAVLFTFVWHITFFAGCMAVSGYAEQRNLNAFGFRVQPLSVAIKGESIVVVFSSCFSSIVCDATRYGFIFDRSSKQLAQHKSHPSTCVCSSSSDVRVRWAQCYSIRGARELPNHLHRLYAKLVKTNSYCKQHIFII